MNKYLVSYYSDHVGEITQSVVTANNELEAVIVFLTFLGDTAIIAVLDDEKAFPTVETIKTQLEQWDSTIAVMKL